MLLIFCLQKAGELNLIPDDYVPFVTTVAVPVLAWIGRVIPQVTLMLGKLNDEQKNNT